MTVVGSMKSGTWATVRAIELLGGTADHSHMEPQFLNGERVVYVSRDPRNVSVSLARWERKPLTFETFVEQWDRVHGSRRTFVPFLEWMDRHIKTAAHVVRFEDLIQDDAEMRRLADFLGVEYSGQFADLRGPTPSLNDTPSDYREVWTKEIDRAWRVRSGNLLVMRRGYNPWSS